jgi:NitT/TauT family transport system substrate-binding protein
VLDRSRFIVGLGAFAAFGTSPRRARAAGRPLAVGYVPSTLFAPVFVAAARGYLSAAGFDATLTPILSGQDSMALAATGKLDVVAAALSAAFYNAVSRSLPIKFVASTAYQPRVGHPSALLIREDLYASGERTPAALRGKKVGWLGGAGAASAYYVARILRPYGLGVKDIQPVNLANPDQGIALERRAVDAVFSNSPFTEAFLRRHLARIIGFPPPGISASGVFFGANLLNDREGAGAVMSALRRAARDLQGNGYFAPDIQQALVSYTKQPAELIRTSPRYDVYPDLRVDVATVEDMQREFIDEGALSYKTPINEALLIARF